MKSLSRAALTETLTCSLAPFCSFACCDSLKCVFCSIICCVLWSQRLMCVQEGIRFAIITIILLFPTLLLLLQCNECSCRPRLSVEKKKKKDVANWERTSTFMRWDATGWMDGWEGGPKAVPGGKCIRAKYKLKRQILISWDQRLDSNARDFPQHEFQSRKTLYHFPISPSTLGVSSARGLCNESDGERKESCLCFGLHFTPLPQSLPTNERETHPRFVHCSRSFVGCPVH